MVRVVRDTNEENELNKQELKRKQDDYEQFQKVSFFRRKSLSEGFALLLDARCNKTRKSSDDSSSSSMRKSLTSFRSLEMSSRRK